MKITSLLALCLALLVLAAPRAARAQDVSFDVFYNALSDEGEWYDTPEYGYVFQPDVAFNNEKWRPYTDGYWAQTDDGWTWVAYENFGWATYHYGRWTRLKDTGWVWVPGYEWGPGWVSWRTSDDKVGWAPLPPKANLAYIDGKDVTASAPVRRSSVDYTDVEEDYSTGYTPSVDEDYDIGPENYCFVETRRFGDPRLSEVILPPAENIVYIENSSNVTYITYQTEGNRRFIYNRGPDYGYIRGRCERPIQELRIERHDDPGYLREGIRRGGNANRVQDGVLQVAAPAISRRPMDFQQLRPNKVKRTLDKPQILRGWQGAQVDPARVAKVKEKIKQQSREPMQAGAASAGRLQRRNVAAEAQPAPAGPAAPAPGVGAPPPVTELNKLSDQDRAARRAARQQARQQAGQPGQPQVAPAQLEADKAARKAARQQQQAAQPGQPQVAPAQLEADKAARKAARQQQQAAQPGQPQVAPAPVDAEKAARKAARQQQAEQAAQPQGVPAQMDPEKAARKAARQQQAEQAGQQQAQAAQQAEQEKAARKAARQQQLQQPQAQPQNLDPEKAARKAARQQQAQQQQQQQQQQRQQQQPQAPRQQPQQQRSPEERAARQAARQAQAPAQQQQPQKAQPQPQADGGDKKKDKDRQ